MKYFSVKSFNDNAIYSVNSENNRASLDLNELRSANTEALEGIISTNLKVFAWSNDIIY